ncbi:MAG TPA: sugar phosphate isomerase/epimerase [Gemmatimonadaceae bacterium]|nr:sugar phosphate isomerase/epimerase [Gemmatimonadaceae bacterium]
MPDRRSFLSQLGTAALALAASPLTACRTAQAGTLGGGSIYRNRKLRHIGLQLYTVRDAMQRDLPGTLSRVAMTGYQEVEFAGYFGRKPAELRALLAQSGLLAPSSHVGYPELGDSWARTVNDAKVIGCQYVTVPWIDEKNRTTADGLRRVADTFNQAAAQAKAQGLAFAYHNHDFEFKPVEGVLPFDLLLERTDPTLVKFEMDIYWVTKGGADPLAYLAKYPTRFTMVHAKDATAAPERAMVDVGSGTINFRRIFAEDANRGGYIQHVFVEHDQPADPMASIRNSYEYLSKLTF